MENNQPAESIWVEADSGNVPPGALVGGYDINGEPIYVARAEYSQDIIPGKLMTSHRCMFLSWGGEEVRKTEYEVLVGSTNIWVPARGNQIPIKAYAGGYTKSGEILYIGRVRHQGSLTTGKVQQSQGVCFIAFGGQEISYSDYEVLTY